MTVDTRLRRLESAAERREQERVIAEADRALAAVSLDAKKVFLLHLERDILADCPWDAETIASLHANEKWLAEMESQDPGFTHRVESELAAVGLLETDEG